MLVTTEQDSVNEMEKWVNVEQSVRIYMQRLHETLRDGWMKAVGRQNSWII